MAAGKSETKKTLIIPKKKAQKTPKSQFQLLLICFGIVFGPLFFRNWKLSHG